MEDLRKKDKEELKKIIHGEYKGRKRNYASIAEIDEN
jgi:hypothetical protein